MSLDTTTTQTQATDGFWSTVGETLSGTVKELLPIWAASELQSQQTDQLNNATGNYNGATATTTQNATTSVSLPSPNFMWTLMIGALVMIVVALLVRR